LSRKRFDASAAQSVVAKTISSLEASLESLSWKRRLLVGRLSLSVIKNAVAGTTFAPKTTELNIGAYCSTE
jgi:hypothetical protein